MAADTLRVHIMETETTIKQTFDDKSVSRAQVAYCYIIVANDLLSKHIAKRDSGAFLNIFDNIPIESFSGSDSAVNLVKDRKFIELPGLIFDYDKDGAIEYLSYISDGGPGCPPRFTRTTFSRTSQSESRWLYMHPATEPSPKNPYFYRAGSKIYTLGIEAVPVKYLEAGFYLTVDPLNKIDIDKPFNFPQELLKTLKMQVIDLIRYNWFFPKDNANTGEDETSAGKVSQQKIVSVNPQTEQ
jgi:hypothetical protein